MSESMYNVLWIFIPRYKYSYKRISNCFEIKNDVSEIYEIKWGFLRFNKNNFVV